MIEDDDALAGRLKAQMLFFQGYLPKEIAALTDSPLPTVYSWIKRGKWREAGVMQRATLSVEVRLNQVLFKKHQTDRDREEVEHLFKLIERADRQSYARSADKGGGSKGGKREPKLKNYFSPAAVDKLDKAFIERQYPHQKIWYESQAHKLRDILKSRQIGATDYFGIEAFMKGVKKKDKNEKGSAFISASKAQAYQFKEYIVDFVQNTLGEEIKGDPLIFNTDVGRTKLDFLGTNYHTAQGRPAHTYLDESMWMPNYRKIREVAFAMATQKFYKATSFSTPSSRLAEAYYFWAGEWYNDGRNPKDHVKFDIDHAALKKGKLCPDNVWRQIVTFDDAYNSGFDLFDREEVKAMVAPDIWKMLYDCEFVDDQNSPFPIDATLACGVDSWIEWHRFYKPSATRPLGDLPVIIGYDPSLVGDFGKVVVIALPRKAGDKFRLVDKLHFSSQDFTAQAASIKKLTTKYNVQHISVDTEGMGLGVFKEVKKFFRRARKVDYTPDGKTLMVTKLQTLINRNMFEYDIGDMELPAALASIERKLTDSGRKLTYKAGRSKEVGHADVAWAALNAFDPISIDNLMDAGEKRRTKIYLGD